MSRPSSPVALRASSASSPSRPADRRPSVPPKPSSQEPADLKVIKADLVSRVAEDAEVPRVTAAQAVDTILDSMKSALADGKRIELRGFGVFQVRDRKKGMGRNPKTGDEVPISPGKTVRFKPGKDLRDID